MLNLASIVAGFAAAGLFATAAAATPLPRAHATGDSAVQVEKVHGFHRGCAWGPARLHRHVPGVGNVPCYRGGGYYRPPVYGGPRIVLRFGGRPHHRYYGHHRRHW